MMDRHPTRFLACIVAAGTAAGLLFNCKGEKTVSFRLEKTTINLGDEPIVILDKPFKDKEGSTFWFTVEAPGDSHEYDHRHIIAPGETRITLEAPRSPGVWMVSLNESTSLGHEYWVQLADLRVESDDTSDLEVTFVLNKSTLELDEDLMVSFDKPLAPRVGECYVMTAVPAGEPDDYILNNVFGDRGSTGMWLYTPQSPGNHEVRLLAREPTEFGRVIYRRPLVVKYPQAEMPLEESEDDNREWAFEVEKSRFAPGEAIHVTFDPPLFAPKKYPSHYITVVPPEDPDESYPQSIASYKTPSRLGIGQREFTFDQWRLEPGKYEIRLLLPRDWPEFRVLYRHPIEVLPPSP